MERLDLNVGRIAPATRKIYSVCDSLGRASNGKQIIIPLKVQKPLNILKQDRWATVRLQVTVQRRPYLRGNDKAVVRMKKIVNHVTNATTRKCVFAPIPRSLETSHVRIGDSPESLKADPMLFLERPMTSAAGLCSIGKSDPQPSRDFYARNMESRVLSFTFYLANYIEFILNYRS